MKILITALLLLPSFAQAQATAQSLVENVTVWLGTVVVPFLLGIAFLIFVINAIRYFVVEGADSDGREKAKALALYSVLAFVVLIVFWGMVNMFAAATGLQGVNPPTPDYLQNDFNKTSGGAG